MVCLLHVELIERSSICTVTKEINGSITEFTNKMLAHREEIFSFKQYENKVNNGAFCILFNDVNDRRQRPNEQTL